MIGEAAVPLPVGGEAKITAVDTAQDGVYRTYIELPSALVAEHRTRADAEATYRRLVDGLMRAAWGLD